MKHEILKLKEVTRVSNFFNSVFFMPKALDSMPECNTKPYLAVSGIPLLKLIIMAYSAATSLPVATFILKKTNCGLRYSQ